LKVDKQKEGDAIRKTMAKDMEAQAKALESRYRRLFSNPSANADDYVKACLPPNASAYTDTFNGRWRLTYKCGGTKLCRSISWTVIGDRAAAAKALTALWSWAVSYEGCKMPDGVERAIEK
jgi:hypothetical protein